MSKHKGGVATRPYKCLLIHIIGRTQKECDERLDTLNQMVQAGDVEYPDWAEVTRNHGGGGGP